MIKCKFCVYHQQRGNVHKCIKCQTKTIYGEMQEPFIEFCLYYKMTESEKKRRAYFKKINSLPIDDRRRGGKKIGKEIINEIKKPAYKAEYRRAYYKKNREKILKKQKEYDDQHREEIKEKRAHARPTCGIKVIKEAE